MEKITNRQLIKRAIDYAQSISPAAASKSCWQQLAPLDAENVDIETVRDILTPGYEYMVQPLKCDVCDSIVDEILRFEFDVDTCAQTQPVHMCKNCLSEANKVMES